jgi:hypothetical protein
VRAFPLFLLACDEIKHARRVCHANSPIPVIPCAQNSNRKDAPTRQLGVLSLQNALQRGVTASACEAKTQAGQGLFAFTVTLDANKVIEESVSAASTPSNVVHLAVASERECDSWVSTFAKLAALQSVAAQPKAGIPSGWRAKGSRLGNRYLFWFARFHAKRACSPARIHTPALSHAHAFAQSLAVFWPRQAVSRTCAASVGVVKSRLLHSGGAERDCYL